MDAYCLVVSVRNISVIRLIYSYYLFIFCTNVHIFSRLFDYKYFFNFLNANMSKYLVLKLS